ncbi:MAG: mandelate racemase/muconate lactonizing enzyme family protein [Victivallales bacterium]|jgi:L-alanine-DL-glutamate epimerase-like enolase superfamily enzyme|nr:mandelate racemase/muconate lactonizing enzyme family protein [Victivallales bacterium]MBT7165929.1 mandelate racemase/muconate lactonizing enzyme family protein [Victivallales bacterium]MBT7301198.1 mandelate racemase/muconate lactonizing enzyme family protein [Victivallales bacterium]
MQIKRIETFVKAPHVCIVRVTTEDGQQGYGQAAPFNADITAIVLHRQVARHALGRDSEDIDGLVDQCFEGNYKFPWSYVSRAVAGIDTALWDLRGRRAGKSVCELLGGQPRPFPVYGSSMQRGIRPEEEAARLARLRDSVGYTAFKVRIGSVCGHDKDQWPGRTDNLIPAVRKSVGDDVRMLVDANSCYTPAKATEVGRMLEDHGVCHFEEPCPYWELEWTAKVTRALALDVAGGEQDVDLAQWHRMIEMRAVDVVQPDVCYLGGLTRALRVAKMAEKAGLPVVPHSANPSMVTVFALHMMGAIPNAGPYVEFSIESSSWTEALFEPVLEVRDGNVQIPSGLGWGVEIAPAWLAGAEHQVSSQ